MRFVIKLSSESFMLSSDTKVNDGRDHEIAVKYLTSNNKYYLYVDGVEEDSEICNENGEPYDS